MMRSQGCTIQQALTPEAAAMVTQAVALARRRGHAQVTPLHVAHTMLAAPSGLLRAACLRAHSHPLQCRALELCFNVALNRLPTTAASGPMLGGPHLAAQPSIANALVAAFKRAQAHQRRGSIESQQQPLLTVKIELEQLIISILDDPSVSRVMREAGFSSTLVKAKVEQAISLENQPPNNSNNNNTNMKTKDSNNNSTTTISSNSYKIEKQRPTDRGGLVRNEDVMSVLEGLMNRRKRNSVIVGECIATLESLVREVVNRVEKGDVPEGLKGVKFVPLSLSSFGHLSREEVEQKVTELKCLVKSCCVDGIDNKGVILYLDDLKWANEFRASSNCSNILGDQYQPRSFYCPIEHIIMEIGTLVSGYAECGKLWLLGIATFHTYMRCKSGQPSLETTWGLHAITIPASSLGLSLIPDSDLPSPLMSKKNQTGGTSWLMLEDGRRSSPHNIESTTSSSLPSWLQQYKDENTKRSTSNMNDDQDTVPVKDLSKRWSSICTSSTHHISQSLPSFERNLSFSSVSPSSSTSNFSYDHHCLKPQPTHQNFEPKNFWVNDPFNKTNEPTFTMYMHEGKNDHTDQQRNTQFVSSLPSSTPTSTSSSDVMDQMESQCTSPRFKEYNAENLKTLCNSLEQKVPHHKDVIFDIATTILHCRSGMSRRKLNNQVFKNNEEDIKEETWLFFQGVDMDAKEKIAKELARIVFGSQDKFVSIALSSFSSTRADSSEDSRNKRLRDENSCSYVERFAEAVSNDPHRVFFVEDIEQVDYSSQMGIKKAIERGRITKYSSEEEVRFKDAIIIFSCESFSSRSRACSPSTKHKLDASPQENDQNITNKGENGVCLEETISPSISLDLNISINDEDDDASNAVQGQNMDEIGLLASVDRCIIFKNHLEL